MRSIKFRAWNEPVREMVYCDDKHYWAFFNSPDSIGYGLYHRNDGHRVLSGEYIPPVMQFTGLTDKSGTDIYEGDIVKDRFGRIMQVKWWNYRLCWVAITDTNFHHADLYDWVDYDELGNHNGVARVEVIGNIYEHPHLLAKINQQTP